VQQHLKSDFLRCINKVYSSIHLFIHSPVFYNNSIRTETREDEKRIKHNLTQGLYAHRMTAKATSKISGASVTSTCLQKSKKKNKNLSTCNIHPHYTSVHISDSRQNYFLPLSEPTSIVRNAWCCVKQTVDPMSTVTAYHRKSMALCVLLDHISDLSVFFSWAYCKSQQTRIQNHYQCKKYHATITPYSYTSIHNRHYIILATDGITK
jgi:hypothetical protein